MFAEDVLGPTVATLAALSEGGPAVEFAIGTGRVAIPLLESGIQVAGIELAHAMVSRLREKVGEDKLPVVVGDMAKASAGDDFALAYLVFNGISTLLTQDEQVACFRNAAAHLRPGGRFVIELWVPEIRALTPGRSGTVEVNEPGRLLVDTIDTLHQLVVSHHISFDPDVDGDRTATIWRSPHRYIWPSELDLMAKLAGFALESRWSGWRRDTYTSESESHVSVYRLSNAT